MRDDPERVRSLCESVDRYAAARLRAADIDRAGVLGPELLAELAELGLFGLSVPTAYDGLGLTLAETAAVCATLAAHDRSVATTIGLHAGLGSRPLVARGSRALQDRLLPRLASGKAIAAFGTTEPGAGSDLGAIRTRALPDGDGWRLDGNKIFVTNGGFASVYTFAATVPVEDGASPQALFVVERSDPGLEVGAEERKLGLRGSSTTSVTLDGVRIPGDRRIGAERGLDGVADALGFGRTLLASGCVGTGRAALRAMVRHVRERRQFRRPLLASEVVQAQVTDAAGLLFAMEALVGWAARQGEAFEQEALAAKILCSEGAFELADLAIQLHGGSGYVEDTGVALLLRDARITRIFEGANDVLRIRLGLAWATARPRWPVEPPVRRASERGSEVRGLARALWTTVTDEARVLAERHGVRLALRHRDLHRLGDAAVLAVAAAAVADRAEHDPELALVFLERARAALSRLRAPECLVPRAHLAQRLAEVTP